MNETQVTKNVYFSGIKIFNYLPQNIKICLMMLKTKKALKRFLLVGSFYTLEEYFSWDQ
jgi:hypothetical protein